PAIPEKHQGFGGRRALLSWHSQAACTYLVQARRARARLVSHRSLVPVSDGAPPAPPVRRGRSSGGLPVHRRLVSLPLPLALKLIAALALCLLALNTAGLWMNLRDLAQDSARAERAWTTITTARRALGLVLDAET